jgi:HK97 family phage portal protein
MASKGKRGLFDRFRNRENSPFTIARPQINQEKGSSSFAIRWPGDSADTNFQTDGNAYRHKDLTRFSAVYSCVNIISTDVAKLPARVYRDMPNGGFEQVPNHYLARLMRNPNQYQTRMDFITQLITSVLMRGNSYVYFTYDNRNVPTAMYVLDPDSTFPLVDRSTGEVYYSVGQNDLAQLENNLTVPARFIMHHRLMTFKSPLCGVTPLYAAATSALAGLSIQDQQASFFNNQARPSGMLTTEEVLDEDVIARLRMQWENNYSAKGSNYGGTAVLEQGLTWTPLTMSAMDAQIIEQLKFDVQDVASAFRVPTFLLGDLERATYKNAETLFRVYLSTSLSYYVEGLENRFNTFFGLENQNLRLNFDTDQFLRTDFETRMNGLKNAIQGGIYTPNEARRTEGLSQVEGGDSVYLQQQMAPIDKLGDLLDSQIQNNTKPPEETPPAEDEVPDDVTEESVRAAVRARLSSTASLEWLQ